MRELDDDRRDSRKAMAAVAFTTAFLLWWSVGILSACDQLPLPAPSLAERRVDQAVRPNTDARGERLCADHGGYEGYASGMAPSVAGRPNTVGGGSALLCFDGTAFRTFNTGPSDRWIRNGETE